MVCNHNNETFVEKYLVILCRGLLYHNNKLNEKFKLKLLYLQFPLCSLKRVIGVYENKWFFRKIFNNVSHI